MSDKKQSVFTKFAKWTSSASGKPTTFILAVLIIVVWAVTGPLFGFSDTWQLVINTGTTIVTFLMVFLIQNTQNRDTMAIQLKLDELICSLTEARDEMIDVEDLDEKDLEERRREMLRIAHSASKKAEVLEDLTDETQSGAKK